MIWICVRPGRQTIDGMAAFLLPGETTATDHELLSNNE